MRIKDFFRKRCKLEVVKIESVEINSDSIFIMKDASPDELRTFVGSFRKWAKTCNLKHKILFIGGKEVQVIKLK